MCDVMRGWPYQCLYISFSHEADLSFYVFVTEIPGFLDMFDVRALCVTGRIFQN